MTDHLEPYRRMARSIRFFPPSALALKPIPQPVPADAVADSWVKNTNSNVDVKSIEPPINLSERAAALVQEAVCKPTVLPVTYTIPENIGDRISRLVASKSGVSVNTQPNISQPALNGKAVHSSDDEINADRLVYDAHRQVYALASTIVAPAVAVEEPASQESVTVEELASQESVTVEELASQESVTVEELVGNESVLETDTSITEVEEVKPPTLLEKVSSVIEAVSTAFMNPEVVPKQKEAPEEPAPLNSQNSEELLTTEASLLEAEAEAASSLLERVSAVVEVVTNTLKNQAAPETASETKPITANCPACGSVELRKNGRRQGKQRYACKDCGRQFATADAVINEEEPQAQDIAPVQAETIENAPVATEVDASSPLASPLEKIPEERASLSETATNAKSGIKKKKAKGFGASKKSK